MTKHSALLYSVIALTSPQIMPEAIFVKESTAIVITAGAPSSARLILSEVDAAGKQLRSLGPLTDDGVVGDDKAHDGIYSRKLQMSEKKSGPRFFVITNENDGTRTAPLTLQVIGRPSFIQMVEQAWAKIIRR